MDKTAIEREADWSAFLERWPLESLVNMSLEQYTAAGDQDCFVYWLESRTESVGSIWGGSAFKFGIYSRRNTTEKSNESRLYGPKYAWYSKYGTTEEVAFGRIRDVIVDVAQSARNGHLERIDQADIGHAVKWKLAFLYQDRGTLSVLPVFKADYLRAYLGSEEKRTSELHRAILGSHLAGEASRGSIQDLFNYTDRVWNEAQRLLRTELSPVDAQEYFDKSDRFTSIKAPTKKMAGYQTLDGAQLALELDRKVTTLYVKAGDWLDDVDGLREIDQYEHDRSRNSNLEANAPQLGAGIAIAKVVVPDMATLIALCDAYESADIGSRKAESGSVDLPLQADPPLNQILYGPPGTGKTFTAIDAALEILDPPFLADHKNNRSALKSRFDTFAMSGHVRFVTFHQSFSYEDFVEGLRAETDENGRLYYDVADGVFKTLCDAAAAKVIVKSDAPLNISGRRIWKMSLGNSLGSDSYIFDDCLEYECILLGYGRHLDFAGQSNRQAVQAHLAKHGYPSDGDSYEATAVNMFVNKIKVGDLVVVSEGNFKFRAIGEVTGDYRRINREEQGDSYVQCRSVKWLRIYQPSLPFDQIMLNQFSQMTLYELKANAIDSGKLATLLSSQTNAPARAVPGTLPFHVGQQFGKGYRVAKATSDLVELTKPNGNSLPVGLSMLQTLADYVGEGRLTLEDIRKQNVFKRVPDSALEPNIVNRYSNILPQLVQQILEANGRSELVSKEADTRRVLIIDEINRGNISRIFGELITLIEPSKRVGEAEQLEVILPYSKRRFSVPKNVYLIGTMNTADRSLAGLDIALRRRFSFREMPPRSDLLDDIVVEGINIGVLLKTMNQRIEVLLDRDHCLGHAFFLSLRKNRSLGELERIFRSNIIPLLQEYFFEDWQRIQWVLNDHRKPTSLRFISKQSVDISALFGSEAAVGEDSGVWKVNDDAFGAVEAYSGIVAVREANSP